MAKPVALVIVGRSESCTVIVTDESLRQPVGPTTDAVSVDVPRCFQSIVTWRDAAPEVMLPLDAGEMLQLYCVPAIPAGRL